MVKLCFRKPMVDHTASSRAQGCDCLGNEQSKAGNCKAVGYVHYYSIIFKLSEKFNLVLN